eukprot:2624731-Pleurochrysis_carterae.AAC.1
MNLFCNSAYWAQRGSAAPSSMPTADADAPADQPVPGPMDWLTHSRPQEGFVLPTLSWMGRARAKEKHSVFDPVTASFARGTAKINNASQ